MTPISEQRAELAPHDGARPADVLQVQPWAGLHLALHGPDGADAFFLFRTHSSDPWMISHRLDWLTSADEPDRS